MNSEEKLLPCPFCGNGDLLIYDRPSQDGTITWTTVTHKSEVPCSVSLLGSNRVKVISDWNRQTAKLSLLEDLYYSRKLSQQDYFEEKRKLK